MRNRSAFIMLLLCALAMPTLAEEAPATDGWIEDLVGNMQFTVGRLVELAEATPADKFGWSPTDEVRTVSEVYMHVVGTNMLLPGAMGAAMPEGLQIPEEGPFALAGKWEKEITEKDAVIAKLQESAAYAADAIRQIDDLGAKINLFGFEASKRSYLLILQGHAHEHLGQSIAYARSMGITPPWSQPPPEAAEDKGDS